PAGAADEAAGGDLRRRRAGLLRRGGRAPVHELGGWGRIHRETAPASDEPGGRQAQAPGPDGGDMALLEGADRLALWVRADRAGPSVEARGGVQVARDVAEGLEHRVDLLVRVAHAGPRRALPVRLLGPPEAAT